MSATPKDVIARWTAKRTAARKVAARADRVIKRWQRRVKAAPKPFRHLFGIDEAWSRVPVGVLKANGKKFVCRYLSYTPSKNLSRTEAKALAAAGIDVVVVWESTGGRALGGYQAGRSDAKAALALARQCGLPAETDPITHQPIPWAIYFAVDFNETPGQASLVASYAQGFASVIGKERTGVYGGYWVVKRLLDAKLLKYGWQTYAWSGGQWDPRAQLHQYRNGVKLGGADIDLDEAVKPDFGQWRP